MKIFNLLNGTLCLGLLMTVLFISCEKSEITEEVKLLEEVKVLGAKDVTGQDTNTTTTTPWGDVGDLGDLDVVGDWGDGGGTGGPFPDLDDLDDLGSGNNNPCETCKPRMGNFQVVDASGKTLVTSTTYTKACNRVAVNWTVSPSNASFIPANGQALFNFGDSDQEYTICASATVGTDLDGSGEITSDEQCSSIPACITIQGGEIVEGD